MKTIKPFLALFFALTLSVLSIKSYASISIAYESAGHTFPFKIQECSGGTIYLQITNDPTPLNLPLTLRFTYSGGNQITTTGTSGLNSTASSASSTIVSGGSTVASPNVAITDNGTSIDFVITDDGTMSTIPANGVLKLQFNLTPSCQLMGDNGAFIGILGSVYPIDLTPTFTLYNGSTATGSSVSTYTATNPIKVEFPYLLITTPDPTHTPGEPTVSSFVLGNSFDIHSGCERQTFNSIPSGGFINKRITITNYGNDLDFSASSSNSHPSVVKIIDTRSTADFQVVDVFDKNGNSVSPIITHISSTQDEIILDASALSALLPSGSTAFADGDYIDIYEKLAIVNSVANLCNQSINSTVTCSWNCLDSPDFCYQSPAQCNIFYFQNHNPLMTWTASNSTITNFCYDGVAHNRFFSDYTNQGDAPALNSKFTFSTYSGSTQWTDYDFSTGATGLIATLASPTGSGTTLTAGTDYTVTTAPGGHINPVVNSYTIQFTTPIPPQYRLRLSWGVINYAPTAGYECSANIYDNWYVDYYYDGACNDVDNLHPTHYSHSFSRTSTQPGTVLYNGPNNMVGQKDHVYGTQLGTSVFMLPNIVNQYVWPSSSTNSYRSFIVRIELGSDLNVWKAFNDPSLTSYPNADHADVPTLSYSSTDLANNITFTSSTGAILNPNCINYVSGGGAPQDGQHDVIEARFDFSTGGFGLFSQFSSMTVAIKLEPHCNIVEGVNPVKISYYEVPDNTCDGTLGCPSAITNRIPLGCDNNEIINVQCPGCQIVGLYQDYFAVSRKTFGLQDVNNNGLAEGTPITFSDAVTGTDPIQPFTLDAGANVHFVADHLMMYNDEFETRSIGTVQISPYHPTVPPLTLNDDGNGHQGFLHAFTRVDFGGNANYISMMDPQNTEVQVYWREPTTVFGNGTAGQWYGPIDMTVDEASGHLNTDTHEFCFDISIAALKQALTNRGLTTPCPDIFMDGMNIMVDCNFKLTHNFGAVDPIDCDIFTTTYLGLRDEAGASISGPGTWPPGNWLVEMQNDPNFGSPTYLDGLCDNPVDESTYSYKYPVASGANTNVGSCDDVRWYCIQGVGRIKLVGFNWVPSSHLGSANTSCYGYLQISANYPRKMAVGSHVNQFPFEYRNWAREEKLELFGLPNGGVIGTPFNVYHGLDYNTTFWQNTNTLQHSYTDLQDIVNGPTESYVDYPTFMSGLESHPTPWILQPDDGFNQSDVLPIHWPCGTDHFKLVVRETTTFPNNDLASEPTMTDRPLTSYPAGVAVPTPSINSAQHYYDQYFDVEVPKPNVDWNASANVAIGSAGQITWNEPIINAQHAGLSSYGGMNPWVGFNDFGSYNSTSGALTLTSGWTITSVTYYDNSGVAHVMKYDEVLDVYFEQGVESTTNPAPNMLSTGNSHFEITAQYCCRVHPTVMPHMSMGIICQPDLLEASLVAAGITHQPVTTTRTEACYMRDARNGYGNVQWLEHDLPASLRDPVMDVQDLSVLTGVTGCGSNFTLKYKITNTSYNYLMFNSEAVKITVPTGSGYYIPAGSVATIVYFGTTVTAPIQLEPGSTTDYFISYADFSAALPSSGSGTDHGIPGVQIPGAVAYMTIEIPITTGCGISSDPRALSLKIIGDNGCLSAACTDPIYNSRLLTESYYYNPLLLNTNSDYNSIHTVISLPSGGHSFYAADCTPQDINLHFSDLLAGAGNPDVGDFNYLHFSLPTGYTLVDAFSGTTDIYGTADLTNPSGNDWVYHFPSLDGAGMPIPVGNIPDIRLVVTPTVSASCSSTMTAVVYSQRSFTCSGTTCDIDEVHETAVPFELDLNPPAPVITTSGLCAPISVNITGCNITWTDNGTTQTGTTGTLDPAGEHIIEATSTVGACSSTSTQTITVPNPVAVVATVTNPTNCNDNDGTITITVSGGIHTMEFTYTWDNGLGNSGTDHTVGGVGIIRGGPGNYHIQVADDNGCTAATDATLGGGTTLSPYVFNTTCNGTMILNVGVDAAGGVAPYHYSWSDGSTGSTITDVTAGTTYCVTVTDDNGCSGTACSTPQAAGSEQCEDFDDFDASGHYEQAFDDYGNGHNTYGTNLQNWYVPNGTPSIYNTFNSVTPYSGSQFALMAVCDGYSDHSEGVEWHYPFAATQQYQVSLEARSIGYGSNPVSPIDVEFILLSSPIPYTYTSSTGCTTTPAIPSGALVIHQELTYSNDMAWAPITFTIPAQTSAYNYLWIRASFSSTASENTTIFAFDHICVKPVIANQLTIKSSTTPISCYDQCDGAIDITVTGGALPYTYHWSNGATSEDVSELCASSYSVTVTDANGCSTVSSFSITQPAELTATAAVTNVTSCNANDGKMDLTISGGTAPYSYSYVTSSGHVGPIAVMGSSVALTGLAPGYYTIVITDAHGCGTQLSEELDGGLLLALNVTNAGCDENGGVICTDISGGDHPYTYSWSDGATDVCNAGLAVGSYCVTVTDLDGCTATGCADVMHVTPVIVSITSTNTCYGECNGTATASATGGNGTYTYGWSNGGTSNTISGLCPGLYTVTVTDATGCVGTQNITITSPSNPLSSTTDGYNAICTADGGANINVTGGAAPYTYHWHNTSTGTDYYTSNINGPSGTYDVTVTDANGCTTSNSYTIGQDGDGLIVVVLPGDACTEEGVLSATASIFDGDGTFTYQWDASTANASYPSGQTTQTATGLTAGNTYSVTMTDEHGCTGVGSVTIDGVCCYAPFEATHYWLHQTEVDGYTSGTTVIWPERVLITEPLDIPDGVTIDATNSDVVFGSFDADVLFHGYAHLRANNSVFRACDETKHWGGLTFIDHSTGQINSCTFKNAMVGVHIMSDGTNGVPLLNNLFKDCLVGFAIEGVTYNAEVSANTFVRDNYFPPTLNQYFNGMSMGMLIVATDVTNTISQNNFIYNGTENIQDFVGINSLSSHITVTKNNFSNVFRCFNVEGVNTSVAFNNNEVSYVQNNYTHTSNINAVNISQVDDAAFVSVAGNQFSFDHSLSDIPNPIGNVAIYAEDVNTTVYVVENEVKGFNIPVQLERCGAVFAVSNTLTDFEEQGIYTDGCGFSYITLNDLKGIGSISALPQVGLHIVEPADAFFVTKNSIKMNGIVDNDNYIGTSQGNYSSPQYTGISNGIEYTKAYAPGDDVFATSAQRFMDNCILDTHTAIYLYGGNQSNPNGSLPYFNNNYLYNYTDFGLYNENYLGNSDGNVHGDIGNDLQLPQSAGRNSFVSNFLSNPVNWGSALDIFSLSNTIYSYGNSSDLAVNSNVQILSPTTAYTSNASCGNEIGNNETETGQQESQQMMLTSGSTIGPEEAPSTQFVVSKQGSVYSLLPEYMDNLSKMKTKRMDVCLSAMAILGTDTDQTEFETFHGAVMGSSLLKDDERNMFQYAYLGHKDDFSAMATLLVGIHSADADVMDWVQLQQLLLNLQMSHRSAMKLTSSEMSMLKGVARRQGKYAPVAKAMLKLSPAGQPDELATAQPPHNPKRLESVVTRGQSFQVFPNPFNQKFELIYRIEEDLVNAQAIVTDILGRVVINTPLTNQNGTIEFDLTGQAPGFYILTVMNNNKKFAVNKVIKE